MKLAKRFAAVALAAVLALSGLTACSLDDKTGAEKEQEQASAASKLSSMSSSSKYTMEYTVTTSDGDSVDYVAASDGTRDYYKVVYSSGEMENIAKDKTSYTKYQGTWYGPHKNSDDSTGVVTTSDATASVETGERKVGDKTYVAVTVTVGSQASIYCFDENNDVKYIISEMDGKQTSIMEVKKWETTCSLDLSAIWDEAVKATSSTSEDAAA